MVGTNWKPLTAQRREEVDGSCQQFGGMIHAAGSGQLQGPQWESPDGLYARLLLCDS
jgi:hypothetical protein